MFGIMVRPRKILSTLQKINQSPVVDYSNISAGGLTQQIHESYDETAVQISNKKKSYFSGYSALQAPQLKVGVTAS